MQNTWRMYTRGKYDTDFSFLNDGSRFPSDEVRGRNIVYRFRNKQFNGTYAKDRKLIALVDSVETELNYKTISINYFKLMTNKISDLICNNEFVIKTGDVKRDIRVTKLAERVGYKKSVNQLIVKTVKLGDACVKVTPSGLSVFSPENAFKVVNIHNVNETKAIVLYEPLVTNIGNIKQIRHIRFEIHFKGKIYECVREYVGGLVGTVGQAVNYEFNGRMIPKEGNWYDTGIKDTELVQWLSINKEADGVYGESIYEDIQDIVFAMEKRITVTNAELDSLAHPWTIIGMSGMDETEYGYKPKLVDGKYMIVDDRAPDKVVTPQSFQQEYKLDNSESMLDILRGYFYELSEMGKTFLSGEYGGNISEETLNNTIKSAIDKANRIVTEVYDQLRDSLYVLCKLNGISINKEDITLTFNIGRTDDDMKVAEISKTLIESGILSKHTVRNRYFGYNEEQSIEEQAQIDKEKGTNNLDIQQFDKNNNQVDEDIDKDDKNNDTKKSEELED